MKFSSIALASSLALASHAAETDSSETEIKHPDFKPLTKTLASDSFFEQFDETWDQRWKVTHAKKDNEFTYNGEWAVEEAIVNPGFKGDKGLVVKSEAAHHAISAKLPQPFDNKDNTLVLQYEIKFQNGLDCGGAYIKLLSAEGQPDEFNNESPYQIMFGPDKCAGMNKIHLILRRKNPHTGEYEEKPLLIPPMGRFTKTTSLYTLIIKPSQEFEIRVDGDVVRAGSFTEERFFNLNPKAEIEDSNDTKPEDWDGAKKIRDPAAVKPEDWDEEAPYLIPDPDQTKPADWDESAPTEIPDPESVKPEYWDDIEDGEWAAPTIPNPECESHGCGPWSAPTIKNPDYKGKWIAPIIENPNYQGEWKPRKIANPDYYEDLTPADLEPIGSLGFELWTMTDSILFDNIYLGHSIEEAEAIGNLTYIPKVEIEEAVAAASAPKPKFEPEEPPSAKQVEEEPSLVSEIFDKTFGKFFESTVEKLSDGTKFFAAVSNDPLTVLLERPGEAFFFSTMFVSALTVAMGLWAVLLYLLNSLFTTAQPPVPVGQTSKEPKIVELKEDEKVEEVIVESSSSESKSSDSKKNETDAVKRQ